MPSNPRLRRAKVTAQFCPQRIGTLLLSRSSSFSFSTPFILLWHTTSFELCTSLQAVMETTSVKSRLASIVSFVSGKDKPTVNVSAIELRNLTEQSFESPESPPVTPTIPDPVLEHAYKRIDRRLLAWYVITFAIVGMASHNIVNSVRTTSSTPHTFVTNADLPRLS